MSPQAKGGKSITRGLRTAIYLALLFIYIFPGCTHGSSEATVGQLKGSGILELNGEDSLSIQVDPTEISWQLNPGQTNEKTITVTTSGDDSLDLTVSSDTGGQMEDRYGNSLQSLELFVDNSEDPITWAAGDIPIKTGSAPGKTTITLNQPVDLSDVPGMYKTTLTFRVSTGTL